MGRSSTGQAMQNRAKIVDCASRLFRECGIEAVSVADIMAAADMTVGGFYKHFASKEMLAEEATRKAFEDAAAYWDRPTPRARQVERYLRPDRRPHCPIIAFAPHAAARQHGDGARAAYDEGTGALLARFSAASPGPARPDDDPEALLLFAAMIGARVLAEAAGDAPWVAALKQAVINAASHDPG